MLPSAVFSGGWTQPRFGELLCPSPGPWPCCPGGAAGPLRPAGAAVAGGRRCRPRPGCRPAGTEGGAGAGRAPGIGGAGRPSPHTRSHTHTRTRRRCRSREGRAAAGTMSTGMRYKSKLVNPGEAAGTRGRSAPRPGAPRTPHSLFFSLLAAGSCRGHPALADPPCRREAGRWVCGRCSPGPAGSVLSRGAAAVGGVLLPGHSGVSAWGLACWPLFRLDPPGK